MQQLELLKLTVRKVGLPPLLLIIDGISGGKPTFPTMRPHNLSQSSWA